ncbi:MULTISPECIES: SGNH/GDSL hydrolase family protein [unclassified Rhodococcus (in: high G+C Gram-positive bacteria)]|uniref:SGNH/GDSL hydrolase family protein n=1 Tax=unclassified Rhodococcus (in: high G+C Gram-positive bacteria) TaxID=192944 RepID=UPI00163AF0AA|nr:MULTISPECIES: SGNH/GDSL hydrolase family protein [unclassified Rhodococcus (in: high G+C Gram-positive bacteria)]MBC2641445.1 SGNH/GDSL hydrolase family protein [Rhodococcus sp. 3A]MBC2893810.1 SGNH/GDSL hydrolase family protein [Rhodococcus sp. 4CII]
MRRWILAVPVAVVLPLVAGCSTTSTSPAAQPQPEQQSPPTVATLVGLGDSIPAGDGCPGCTPFVELFGDELSGGDALPVQVANLGVGGWTSTDLLDSLESGAYDADAVRDADVVTVTIGANDFYAELDDYLDGDCGGDDGLGCFAPVLPQLQTTLTSVLDRITELRDGQPTAVLVTGYWDVFPDGDVARGLFGPQFLRDSSALTLRANDVISEVAGAEGATYVDLFGVFKGAWGDGDPTGLLADDGDHPNQSGHQRIADALSSAAVGQSGATEASAFTPSEWSPR